MSTEGFTKRAFTQAAGAAIVTSLIESGSAAAATGETNVKFNPDDIKAIVFDTVGTLVWTYGTIPKKGAEFTDARGIKVDWYHFLDQWRAEWRIQLNNIIAGTTPWISSDVIYRKALDKTLALYDWGSKLSAADRDQINQWWYELEPWPDTRPGLERLKKKYTISTLSNGSMASVVNIAKLGKLPFDCILTAELVQSAKPDPKVYALGANSLGFRPDQILMVAAHKYDLAAAHKFGFHTAFLPRPLEYGPHGKPDLMPDDFYVMTKPSLEKIADALGA